MEGIVKRILRDKKFGFIFSAEDNREYFFHASALQNIKFDDLKEGQDVEFEDTETLKGHRAENIFAQ